MQAQKYLPILFLSLIVSCGDGDTGQEMADALLDPSSAMSDEFVDEIVSRMVSLNGTTDLLTTFAEYEKLKRASEDQFFRAQLERTETGTSTASSRDLEKYGSIANLDSTSLVLCTAPAEEGYLGNEGNLQTLGICGGNAGMTTMSADDAVRFLSYVYKAEDSNSPLRKITSVRLNRKIRLMFESQRPVYHVIVGEKERGAFKLAAPILNSNGLESALPPIQTSAPETVENPSSPVVVVDKKDADAAKTVEPESPRVTTTPLPDLTNLVTSYLDLQEGDNLDAIMGLYDSRVRYNQSGNIGKARIRKDKQEYFKNWPSRNHNRLTDVTVQRLGNSDEYTARFNYSYQLSDGENDASGRVWLELSVKEVDGSFLIIGEKGGAL